MSNRGITILAIGNKAYLYYAANLMVSIKYFNPELKIHLIVSKGLTDYLHYRYYLWDYLTFIDNNDLTDKGFFSPGKAKLSLYKYFFDKTKWSETVYLDVDGIILKDISDLFLKNVDFAVQKDGYNWLLPEQIKTEFDIKTGITPPGINDSYWYVRKCKTSEKIFKTALYLLQNKQVALNRLKESWFKQHPDELYMSASLALNSFSNCYPVFNEEPIYFRNRHEYKQEGNLTDIIKNHYLLGCYGNERFCHISIGRYYDKLMQIYSKSVLNENNIWKYHKLINQKHKYNV